MFHLNGKDFSIDKDLLMGDPYRPILSLMVI